ncbi:MAG TPA: potassium-transporting ATPase subunit KdpA [Caulobacteraceae bacterium]|nr:potassium-transporting ATPase subunit KdpA [Caulobacteraceae bacterium]
MTLTGWVLIGVFVALVGALVVPLGGYMAKVFSGESTFAHPVLGSIEVGFYRLCGVDEAKEQGWFTYAVCFLGFHLLGVLVLYGLLRLQAWLPLNPQHFKGVAPDLAFNTAISFVTNTSWQSYAGESTLSNLSQMLGIAVASFLSGAAGVAAAVALIRGFARSGAETIGNFWVDLTRAVLYVFLPLSILGAIVLGIEGVPQTLHANVPATTVEGSSQTVALGPVASQESIKLMSGDGGGFFNANSAHPFENPNARTNLEEMLLIFVVGAALTNTFGRMIGSPRQGWVLLAVMAVLFVGGTALVYADEAHGNPVLAHAGISGANMEGKEVRFGPAGSSLFAEVSTASADGAVNSMHDSYMPISGLVLMANMKIGEVIVGAPGSGLFSMILFAIIAVFIAGLMVGRTPEYLGKKMETREVQFAMLATLTPPVVTLGFTALAVVLPAGLAGREATGPHGLSEILYAFTSAAATNGSAFAGLSANAVYYNVTLALAMAIGRFATIVPVLALAGALAAKPRMTPSAGSMPTDNVLFASLLIGVILIVGGLTYFPVLTLAPGLEQMSLSRVADAR